MWCRRETVNGNADSPCWRRRVGIQVISDTMERRPCVPFYMTGAYFAVLLYKDGPLWQHACVRAWMFGGEVCGGLFLDCCVKTCVTSLCLKN